MPPIVPLPVLPSKDSRRAAVQSLHDSRYKVVLAVAGGAAGLMKMLWDTAGTSRTLIKADMPYSPESFDAYVGTSVKKYCSPEGAVSLAKAAYAHAEALAHPTQSVLGLGVTVALVTDRERRGSCRIYGHVIGSFEGPTPPLDFELTADEAKSWPREVQGELSDLLALNLLLRAAGLEPLPIGFPSRMPVAERLPEPETVVWPDGRQSPASELDALKHVLYPGSFNPLHFGHDRMANAALEQIGRRAIPMIERSHPDKGRLDDATLERRLVALRWKYPAFVTDGLGRYVDKAQRFPGFGFLIGADTACRIFDPKYYDDRLTHEEALRIFVRLGTVFYVLDRVCQDGALRTVHGIPEAHLPADLRHRLCRRLEGRWDVSSTERRAALEQQGEI